MRRVYGLILALCWSAAALAQNIRLSDNPEQFITDLQKVMAAGGGVSQAAQKNLEILWTENRLSAPQKERTIALTRKMAGKKYQAAAHLAPFFESLYHLSVTQSVSPEIVDNYLSIVDKSVDNYDARTVNRILETVRSVSGRRQLYGSNYNRLLADGGSINFRFADASTGASATPETEKNDKSGAPKPTANPLPDSRFDGWDTPLDSLNKTPLVAVINRRPIPVPVGPVIDFKGINLIMTANGDSVAVQKTDGSLGLRDGVFVGKGGTFAWPSSGQIGPAETSVALSDYSLAVNSPRLVADDVTLTSALLAKPVKGTFEYVSKKRVGNQPALYPRFMSWQNDAVLKTMTGDLDYRGGVALAGTRLYSSSVSGQPATLTVRYSGKPAFRVSSRRFEFSADSVITAPLAEFSGYVDTDSLYHPGIQFHFDRPNGVARLYRADRTRFADTYFTDSYHKFYIQPEVVRWTLAKQKIDFYQVGAKKEVPVRFESYDFYHPLRFSEIANNYGFHPLQIAANYVSTKKTQTFMAEDLAQMARVNPNVMRDILNRMVAEGYFEMDPQTEVMRLSRKGVLYVLANMGKKDYDNFLINSRFPSNDSLTNATIDLRNKVMTIRGVERFTISDSLKITAMPTDKTLLVGKGRALTFNGQMKSGNFRYSGQNMAFNYDQFSMNMNKVDSITFTPKGKTKEVGGDIRYEKPGTVYLGASDNKSGRIKDKKTTQRLVMPEGMTVYFDQPYRDSLAYNKKVYFKIPAIDNDSIGKSDIAFVGTFYSDGIFPPFQAKLVTMPDNSLGFEHKAPPAGYPLFGGKGNIRFTGELRMDKKGLRAEGVISHLTASLPAKDILLMTDSLLAAGTDGRIKEGSVGKAYFPAVELKNYTVRWYPKADSMLIMSKSDSRTVDRSADRSFSFYNGSTSLKGDLVLRSTGLFGRGTVKRADAEAVAENIRFDKEGFEATNAQFKILTAGADKATARPVLLGTKIDVDFNQAKGLVNISTTAAKSTAFDDTLTSGIEFPYAAYRTTINKAQWNINAKTIAMKAVDVKTSTFTATAEEQEGLSFNGAAALYDVEKATLNISGVPYVVSADARIFPEKGLVSIKRNGEMLPLKNARLELDTVSSFHKLKNGAIQIQSRTRFAGNATYVFAPTKGDTASIRMENFELQEAGAAPANAVASRSSRRTSGKTDALAKTYFTVAKADVQEKDNLLLAPKIQYQGNITMMAPEQDLKLDGFVRPALKNRKNLVGGWIPFKEKVAEKIVIKVDKNLKNEGNQLLTAGLHFRGGGSTGVYPTFLSAKENDKNDDLFVATGEMSYDEKDKIFRIVGKDEGGLADEERAFTFDDPKGEMTFAGKLGLMNTGEARFVQAAGTGRANIDSSLVRLNALVAFGFPVPEPVNATLADKIVKANLEEKNDEAADDDLNRLTDKLVPLIGQKAADVYRTKAQNQHVSLAQAGPQMLASLVLSNVNLRWSDKFNAFYSVGKIGVSNVASTDVNAQMEGFVEIRKSDTGDEVTIYLEASPESWFYWDYKPGGTAGGQLAIMSSDQELNDRVTAGGKNTGKDKVAVDLVPADPIEKQQFVDRFLDQYKTKAKPKPQPKVVKKDEKKKDEKKKDKEDTREGF